MNKILKNINIFLIVLLFVFSNENVFAVSEDNTQLTNSDFQNVYFKDDLAEKIPTDIQYPKFQQINYQDDLINKSFINKNSNINNTIDNMYYSDDFAKSSLKNYQNMSYKAKNYNFVKDKFISVKIKALQNLSTKNIKEEGIIIDFITVQNVLFENKIIIPKGTIIQGRIETVSPNEAKGIPADLTIGNFKYNDNINLDGQIIKSGANRFYWVIPLAGLSGFLLIGSDHLIKLIRGGHAKIRKNQIYEIFLVK